MKGKSIGIIATVIVLVLAVVAIAVFVVMPRYQSMMGSGPAGSRHGPGMMGGSGKAAGGLVAVTSAGKTIELPEGIAELPENKAMQKVGNLNISLALSPYPPVSFQSATFDVTLMDDMGNPVPDAKILLDLTMPEMPMPINNVEVKAQQDGVYQGAGRFTMRGWWRIEVIIQQNGQKTSAFFDVWL